MLLRCCYRDRIPQDVSFEPSVHERRIGHANEQRSRYPSLRFAIHDWITSSAPLDRVDLATVIDQGSEERSRVMLIIGCDFHSRFQQIAMLNPTTGEVIVRRLEHENGEAKMFSTTSTNITWPTNWFCKKPNFNRAAD